MTARGVSVSPSGDGTCDVTFRWHSDHPVVVDVHLTGHVGSSVFQGSRLEPVGPGTYAVVLRLPDDGFVSYGFLVTPEHGQSEVTGYLTDRLVHDPHNPDIIRGMFGMAGSASVLELPKARRHPAWVGPPSHEGCDNVDDGAVVLSLRTRRLTVLPGDLSVVVLMFDGDIWADPTFGFRASVAARSARGLPVAPTLVLVSTPDRKILDERVTMARLVTDEVIPALTAAGVECAHVCVAGQSYGGLAAAGLFIDLPDIVEAAILQSGSFWFDEDTDDSARDFHLPGTLTRLLAAAAPAPDNRRRRLVVQAGSTEGDMLDQSIVFSDVAERAGFGVHREIYSGGHDYAWYRHAMLFALDTLFGGPRP